MNLDELQSVQAKERQSSDLQQLRPSFYEEVGEFIQSLRDERQELVEELADPFGSKKVRRLSDDIQTAESTVEAIYERRVGKVVKKASIAAADMPVEVDGLTDEEIHLFEELVAQIEENRQTVLTVLDIGSPATPSDQATEASVSSSSADQTEPMTSESPDSESPVDEGPAPPNLPEDSSRPEPAKTDESLDPASLMSSGSDSTDDPQEQTAEESQSDGAATGAHDTPETERVPKQTSTRATTSVDRTTVRITTDIGEVVGADNRDYHLHTDDVVTLPEPNATVLIDKGAAERLE